ncbi:MAG: hypothetical protein GXP18_07630 [Gammaproteobacteria bacterium]|nr:hypothetical protein [Gammaproteobacteria bacterium]
MTQRGGGCLWFHIWSHTTLAKLDFDKIIRLNCPMIFRQIKTCALSLWVLLLSVALLCAQNVTLHVHSLGHDHEQQHAHASSGMMLAGPSSLSAPHLSSDLSHAGYHNEIVSELDASPDVLLKKVSGSVLVSALWLTVLALLLPGFSQRLFHRHRDRAVTFSWRYLFSPPLRAPPI